MTNPAPPAATDNNIRMVTDGRTLDRFLMDFSFVTIIRGPWASGKSVACCGKLFKAAHYQLPAPDGVRRTRWAVVRNSYPDLKNTTLKTWHEWFPPGLYPDMIWSRPFQHTLRMPGNPHNGQPTKVDAEVLFLALDDDNDRKKLLSMEFTGAWINEAREISKPIIDDLIGRTGRYPSKRMGGHTWSGVFMDTNAPAEHHWLPIMMGEVPPPDDMSDDERSALVKPDSWKYFVQPGALLEKRDASGNISFEPNPKAENIANLTEGHGYYMNRIGGKPRSWIRINFCNQLGQLISGKPVWPGFERDRHVAPEDLAFDPNLTLYVGIDQTGRNPAAVLGQSYQNKWRVLGELCARDTNNNDFAVTLRRKITEIIRPAGKSLEQVLIAFYRDPHMQRSEQDDTTADMIYRKNGIKLMPAPGGNTIKTRLDTVETIIDNYRILISPSCRSLIAACSGGYRYRKLQVKNREEYSPEPEKNMSANVADALQYMLLGAGEGRNMVKGSEPPKPINTVKKFNPLDRGPSQKPRFKLLERR